MTSPSYVRLALCAVLLVPACSSAPPSPAGPLMQDRAPRFGAPAVAGVDGPLGVTATDTPVQPWLGAPAVVRTTAQIMAAGARLPRRVVDLNAPRFHKIRPDRHNLVQNPDALPEPVASAVDRAPGPLAAATVAAPTVDVATVNDTGSLPPDTMGDVGPTQYFAALNGRFRTINKFTGAADFVLDVDSDVFFAGVSNGSGTSDPRVRYDRRTGRWFVIMITAEVPSRYLVAVSSGPAITSVSGWAFYQWTNTRRQGGAGGGASCLGDYPTLGVDADALYIGVNQFCGTSLNNVGFDSSSIYVVKKVALIGGTLAVTEFDGVLPSVVSAGMITPQGVDNFDASSNAGYIVAVDNLQAGKLLVRKVTSVTSTPALSADVAVAVQPTSSPNTVPQAGSTARLDGLDDRLLQAVIRNGRLWTTHQVRVDATGAAVPAGTRNGVRWYELGNLATTPSVVQSGTVFDSSDPNPLSFWMGSIMPNGQGHVALGMSVSGAAARVNTAVTGRLASDPAGTMGAPVAFSNNTSFAYEIQGASAVQRWGDYSYTSVDPDDDMTMWTLQQYVNATNSYAVRLTRLLAPPPAVITAVAPSALAPGQTTAIVSVTGSAVNGRGFFEPGPGFLRHLTASLGAGVTVKNVVVTSPTFLSLTLDIAANAALGARTLIITNPDGQTTTASVTIGEAIVSGPPQQLTAAVVRSALVLAWQPPASAASDPPTGYVLEAGVTPGGLIGSAPLGNVLGYTLTSPPNGVFYLRVRAQSAAGLSGPSNEVQVVIDNTVPPLAPLALLATVQGTAVSLQWTENPLGPEITGYQVQAGSAAGLTDIGALPLPATARTFAVDAPPGTYVLRVVAVNAAGVSVASNEVTITPGPGTCTIPAAPAGFAASASPGRVLNVRWDAPASGAIPTSYVLQAGSVTGGADIGTVALPGATTAAAGPVPPGPYFLRVFAANACGTSPASGQAATVIP